MEDLMTFMGLTMSYRISRFIKYFFIKARIKKKKNVADLTVFVAPNLIKKL